VKTTARALPILAFAAVAAAPQPWAARGAEVQADYAGYAARLERFHAALTAALKAEAPDLIPKLEAAAAKPPATGYQVLPRLLPDEPPPAAPPRAVMTRYDWPGTRALIDAEAAKLAPLEGNLARAPGLPAKEKRAAYERLAAAYPALTEGERTADAFAQYNNLWQATIAGNREVYDAQTRLENAVLERQSVRDELARPQAAPGRRPDAELRAKEAALSREIHAATDGVTPLPYPRVVSASAHAWVVVVPFETDISDEAFLKAFRSAVEDAWRVVDGPDEYRVVVTLRRLTPQELYRGAPPKPGEPVDLAKHLALFPEGFAVLTTGAETTHVTASRCIVLGSNDQKPRDLAHEFGHILGFKDVYFRGYKDLGADGLEVQEVVAEPGDLMGGSGPVRKEQFQSLLDALAARRP
jgi:hypothetical protein